MMMTLDLMTTTMVILIYSSKNFKNKKWKEAVEEFKGAKDNLQKNGAKKEEIEEIEKKLKKAEKKANRKWWQFWKIF